MKMLKNLLALVVASYLWTSTLAQAAPLTITLDTPFQTVSSAGGDLLTFYATVTNIDPGSTVYLNGDSANLYGPGLALDDTGFWTNAPLALAPGASSGRFELFAVSVPADTAAGLYAGSFSIMGGGAADYGTVGTANFNISVTPVPEPSSVLLWSVGLLFVLCVHGRRARRG